MLPRALEMAERPNNRHGSMPAAGRSSQRRVLFLEALELIVSESVNCLWIQYQTYVVNPASEPPTMRPNDGPVLTWVDLDDPDAHGAGGHFGAEVLGVVILLCSHVSYCFYDGIRAIHTER